MLDFDVEAQAIARLQLDVDRVILGLGVVFALEAQQFGRNAEPASEGLGLRQRTALEDTVPEGRRGAGNGDREQRIVVDERQCREFVERAFGLGAQIFERDERAPVIAFPLGDAGIGVAIARQVRGADASALGHDDRAGGREVRFVEVRIAEIAARSDIDDAQARPVERVGAIAGVGQLRGIGARDQFLLRIAELEAERADIGFEGVGDQAREAGRPFLGEIAVIHFDRASEVETGIVERLARDEIDEAGDIALDHVGADVLVDLDAAEKFRRNVVERQGAAAIGGEDVAPVQSREDVGQAANDDVGAFDREPVGIVTLFEARDIDARNTLQRFGDRTIGESADILGGDHVDHGVGVFLEILRRFERLAIAADDDQVFGIEALGDARLVLARLFLTRIGILRIGRRCGQRADGQARSSGESDQAP